MDGSSYLWKGVASYRGEWLHVEGLLGVHPGWGRGPGSRGESGRQAPVTQGLTVDMVWR